MNVDTVSDLTAARNEYKVCEDKMRKALGTAGAYLAYAELLNASEVYRLASMADEAAYARTVLNMGVIDA